MPDVPIAGVIVHTLEDTFHCVYLIGTHHHHLPCALHEDHISADKTAQRAFGQHERGERMEIQNLVSFAGGRPANRKVLLVCIEFEKIVVVVGEIKRVGSPVAHHKQLHEAHNRVSVAVTPVFLVFGNLFNGFDGRDDHIFELDLNQRKPIDENDHIVAMITVFSIDTKLVTNLVGVFTPVFDIDERIVERSAVVTNERLLFAEQL